jgi:2-C-methyl-D-erythritol 4-phosphate cytidylyltransferase
MAMERLGLRPLLVEGAEDNFKVTTPTDLARFEFELARRGVAVDAQSPATDPRAGAVVGHNDALSAGAHHDADAP